MKFDDITRQSLLYDFYGELLTERQKEVMELYHEENLSLAEIAEEFGISRQGVHDALHKAQKALEEYECKLGLVERFSATSEAISKISTEIDGAISMAAAEARAAEARAAAAGETKASGAMATGRSSVAGRLRHIRSEIEQLEI